jgi:hypothetical protein
MGTTPAAPGVPGAVFGFEADFAGSMRCVPMAVRLKLDQCGLKVSLRQWNRLSLEERNALLAQSCDGSAAMDAYRVRVTGLLAARGGELPEPLPVEAAPPWADPHAIPAPIEACLAARGLAPLSLAQWAALAPLQRYALLKLTRASHDNDNFVPALREFGLLRD